MTEARLLDLTPWLNFAVATFDSERSDGALNAWGNSFPAEELPFGSTLRVGGMQFRLADKGPGQPDSLEPLGQSLEIPDMPEVTGISLLCCGEMGEQRVAVRVVDHGGRTVSDFVAVARGVMIPAGVEPGDEGFACSHLHYPGDYDLALAVPAAWRFDHLWSTPARIARLDFGVNPLFHVLAVTFPSFPSELSQ